MIYLFSILYLSWALWRRDLSLYEFNFDIKLSPPKLPYINLKITYEGGKVYLNYLEA